MRARDWRRSPTPSAPSIVRSSTFADPHIGWDGEGRFDLATEIVPQPKHDGRPLHFEVTKRNPDEAEQSVVVNTDQRCYLDLMNLMLAVDLDNPLPEALRRLDLSTAARRSCLY
ncbi:MAG: hypothetical protein ACUVX9_18470 [Anaerolineae bacterium]